MQYPLAAMYADVGLCGMEEGWVASICVDLSGNLSQFGSKAYEIATVDASCRQTSRHSRSQESVIVFLLLGIHVQKSLEQKWSHHAMQIVTMKV